MMRWLHINVDGEVAPQGSKTRGRYGGLYEDNPKTKPWRDLVTIRVRQAVNAAPWWDPDIATVSVRIVFGIARPKSHYRTGRFVDVLRDDAPIFCNKYPDIDKAARAILDALKIGGAIKDDSRVAMLTCTKVYADDGYVNAGAAIIVRAME